MTKALSGKLFSYDFRGMRSNNPRTANKKRFAACHALMARFEEAGFPIETKFLDPKDVRAYFGGEAIICLRCGKAYRSLAMHLTKIHGWTSDEYKEFYGLPWRRGLSCEETRGLRSESGLRNMHLGFGLASIPEEVKKEAREKAHKAKHRSATPATLSTAKQRIVALNGGLISASDYDAVLSLMSEHDKTAKEVLTSPDLPSMTAFYARMREDPSLAARYAETVEGLSFAAQCRGQMLGKRFETAVRNLRSNGKTVAEIAKLYGVSIQTVINFSAGFEKPRKTHCPKGHLKLDGRCQVCDTENRHKRRGTLPRHVSAQTLMPSQCDTCGDPIQIVRLRGQNRPKLCDKCRSERRKGYYRAYKARSAAK